ncbi:MAG TPA: type II toxin-antitoxin system VapB family antitoxin [Caulobacteraceae bacterium]|jgi:antitoxin VapB
MNLNIKDPEAHRLAQAIAKATGDSMTRVVRDALRDRLAQLNQAKGKASVEELLAIAKRAAAHVKAPPCANDGDYLYDERGLPK